MSKYIKWELIDFFKKKKIVFIFVAALYFLLFIVPTDSTFMNYLTIPTIIVLYASCVLGFFAGAKKCMDSYQDKTFLLESMIPLSPNKILLAKYLLAIILNLIYLIVFIFGLGIILHKADISLISIILDIFKNIDVDGVELLLRLFLSMVASSVSFTAVTTLMFIALKSFFPAGKGLKAIAVVCGGFLINIIIVTFIKALFQNMNDIDYFDIISSLIFLGTSVIYYFISVWFVKNKLEVYS